MAENKELLAILKGSGYQINSSEIVDYHLLSTLLIPLGLKSMVVCVGGRISSRDTAKYLGSIDIPAVSFSGGIAEISRISTTDTFTFGKLVSEILQLEAIVSLFSQDGVESEFPNVFKALGNMHFITNKNDARHFIKGLYD